MSRFLQKMSMSPTTPSWSLSAMWIRDGSGYVKRLSSRFPATVPARATIDCNLESATIEIDSDLAYGIAAVAYASARIQGS